MISSILSFKKKNLNYNNHADFLSILIFKDKILEIFNLACKYILLLCQSYCFASWASFPFFFFESLKFEAKC